MEVILVMLAILAILLIGVPIVLVKYTDAENKYKYLHSNSYYFIVNIVLGVVFGLLTYFVSIIFFVPTLYFFIRITWHRQTNFWRRYNGK